MNKKIDIDVNDFLLKIEDVKNGKMDSLEYIYDVLNIAIRGIAKKYYLPDGDSEDMVQIIKIGIYEGINTFNKNKNVNPITFLKVCGERNLKDVVRTSLREKRKISNTSVSLNDKIMNNNCEEVELGELVADSFLLDEYIEKKEVDELIKKEIYSGMSNVEKAALSLRMEGYAYDEMCELLNMDKKQIDNAIQRAKKHIKNNKTLRKMYA